MENQPGAKKKPKVVEAEPQQNQIETQVQSSLRIIKNRENDAHDDERLSDLIALREQQMELEKVKSEPADEEDDNLPVTNFRSKMSISDYINTPPTMDELTMHSAETSENLPQPALETAQDYCNEVKQEIDDDPTPTSTISNQFSNQNSNGTDYNFFGSCSSFQNSPSSTSTSMSCDAMVDLSVGSLVWASFIGDAPKEQEEELFYPALIKQILDQRSANIKVVYLDADFMKTVTIKKSHVLLLSEDRIRKSDIKFYRRVTETNDRWLPTQVIGLWGRRKPDVDSKDVMSMATKWSGYECQDLNDDTVRLVQMTDCAIVVNENIIRDYSIRMPDNPLPTYELNYNPFTPRVRKTSAVDTLLDKFPFYRHVFHFAPSKLADKYRMQIEHVMGGEVCDKLDVNEHDFSKTILCIAEDKGKTLKGYSSIGLFCLASDIPIVSIEWLEKCLRTKRKRALGKRDYIFEPNLRNLSTILKGYLIKFCMKPQHRNKMTRIAIRLGAICTDKDVSDEAIDTFVDYIAIHYDKKHSSKVRGASNVTLNWFITCIEQKRRINIDSRYLIQGPEIKDR